VTFGKVMRWRSITWCGVFQFCGIVAMRGELSNFPRGKATASISKKQIDRRLNHINQTAVFWPAMYSTTYLHLRVLQRGCCSCSDYSESMNIPTLHFSSVEPSTTILRALLSNLQPPPVSIRIRQVSQRPVSLAVAVVGMGVLRRQQQPSFEPLTTSSCLVYRPCYCYWKDAGPFCFCFSAPAYPSSILLRSKGDRQ
jgi:hypothetical protein